MEIIINFFHPFGAKFLSSCKWGCVVLLLRWLHPLLSPFSWGQVCWQPFGLETCPRLRSGKGIL